jgi:hypothetical protein
MEEQVLKDFIATLQKNDYNYDVVMPKFPELKDIDLQVLKDYVATAEANNYDYSIINPKFPELGFGVKKKEESEPSLETEVVTESITEQAPAEDGLSVSQQDERIFDPMAVEPEVAPATEQRIAEPSISQEQVQRLDEATPKISPELTTEERLAEQPYVSPEELSRMAREKSKEDELIYLPQTGETISRRDPYKGTILSDKKSEFDDLQESLSLIDDEKIESQEEIVVPEMNYNFGRYGFTFEETGGGDAMVVTAANRKKLYVNLDPFLGLNSKESARELRNFIRENKTELKDANQLVKIKDESKIKDAVAVLNAQTEKFYKQEKEHIKRIAEYNESYKKFEGLTFQQLQANPELYKEYLSFQETQKNLLSEQKTIDLRQEQLKAKGAELDRLVGEYTTMKGKQGTLLGGMAKNIRKGIALPFAELISQAHDVDVYVDENATMSEEDYVKAISKIAKDEGLVDKDENLEGLSKEELVKKLGGDTNDLVYVKNLFKVFGLATKSTEAAIAAYSALKDSGTPFDRANRKLIDTIKKGYRRGIVGGDADYFQLEQTLKPRTRSRFSETADYAEEQKILTESVTDVIDNVLDYIPIDAPEASKEFVEQERQKGIIKQGLYGLAESIPSFIGGGPFSRRARMFLFTTSFVKDEMEKNPEFENISENEKKLITIPIALASAYLEERGLRNVLSQRGFLSNLLLRVFKKVPKGATAKTFQRFVAEEVESAAARGALIVGSGALAEFETGFSQQLVELGVKEIYNQVKEKDMFNTPDSIGGWLKQSFEAGLAEAVGGFTMATIPASVSAIKGKRLRTVSNEQFDLFKSILKDPNYKDMYITDLKQRIASGELTVEQGKVEEKDFNRIQAAAQRIPDGYTEQQQKAALELLYQKQELEEQIDKIDPSLAKSKKRQLDEVKKQLGNILETTETEQEIEESIPEMRPKTEEKQEPTDIEVFFQEQEGRETISENLFVNNKGKDKLAPERINKARKIVLTAAKQGAKSIAKLLPNTQIILHETQEEFERYTNKKGKGSIDFKKEGGSTIHINLEKATASTVPHEIFHAVFLDKVKTDKRAQKVANQMVLSIKKTLPKNSELAKRIDAFSKQYTGELQEQQQEEYVAELIGLLSSNEFNYTQLSKPTKNKIVQFFKDLAKIFGINLGQDFGKTDESVIDLINTLAQKTRTGEELTEEDVLDIETLSKEDKELKDDEQELESREQKISNEGIQAIKKVSELSTSIQKSLDFADKSAFNNKLEFKKSLQDRFNKDTYNKIKETYNVKDNKSNNDPGLKNYLIDAYLNETLTAIEAYPDALGWYDSRINGAMSFMEELHPELATDKNAESTFKIALAITSNGNKVYDNFVEANRQYEYFKENGKFDENYSIGDQKNGILSTLRFTNKALQSMSMSEFTNFLTSKYRAGDLKYIKDGKKTPLLPGFAVDEEVYGASIFGPKIGNGFFMNLYGEFNQLTMDRWFMRQYGRITGTLLDFDQAKVDKGDVRLKKAIKALGVKGSKVLESIVPDFKNISNEELANKIQKASMDLKKRALFKSDIKLDEVRKAGNNLSKLYSAEVEAPKNSSQRKFINEVFSELQSKLKEDYGIDITIADLQAVNWYPEKALYQTFKADQNIKQGKVNTSDNEQPDYQSAARKFIKTKGISENKIKENERRRSEQTKREDTNRKSIEQGARQFNKNNIEPSEIKRLKDKIISIKEEVTSNDLKESKETTPASREQKDLIDTITEARFGGFTNDEIKDYLVRVRKFALLKMNVSDFEELPKSFANMKGGVKEGLKLYDKVKKYRIKLEQNNKKRTKLTNTQLNEKVKEFERKQKEPIQKKKDIEIQAREFRAKEEARNKKRKNKLTPNQINEKVRDFRDNKLKERTAAIDEAVLKTEEYRLKETRKNDKRKPILTSQQIMDKTIEYLESQPEFKNEAGERKSLSIQQAKMIVEFQRNSKIKPTETVFEKIVKLKTRIRTEKQTEIDLNKTKSQLRNFMRSVLPRTLDLDENKLYNKLIDNIVKANQTNLINLQKEVLDFAISENVKALKEEFNNLLKGKYIAIQSGRPVAKTVDAETKVLIDGITNNLVEDNDSVTAEEIGATQEKLIKQVNELEKILDKTEEDTQRINALYVAINYNQSILMSDTDINKIDMLETAVDLFNGIVTIGKSKLNEILKKQSEEYRVEFERLYEDITGVSVDLNPDQSQEELAEEKKKLEERRIEKNRAAENKKVINNFRTTLSKIADRIDEALNSNNSLPDVMTRISKLPGEMMGGVAMELVADRIDSATRLYKQRRMENESIIKAKLEEIFGKKWTDKINNFKKANNEIVINLEKYNKISEDYDNNPNGITKRALVKALSEQARIYSQNQMYYLYNQFKDPSNMASFSNMFAIEPVNTGDSKAEIERKQKINQQNAERVMKEIEEKIDPKLKDFADWQVNEFFPELYKYYNQAYKDIYRTNLPYNEFYAGRLYKDIEQKEINMITEGNQFRNSFIGVASTKGRIDNSDAIIAMDGTNALFSYLNDMEYFSAYARPLTNIYKLFNNKYIKDSITSIHGDWVMKMIIGSLEVIAKRGKGELSSADKWLNRFNNYFVVSRIAISPVIMIKQLTSVFTYANDMGIRKWSLYSVKNLPEARKTWKEIRDNSVYMQDRSYDSISKVLTTYAEKGIIDFDPKNKIDRGIRFATSLVKFGDRTAIMVGGMANYNFYKDQYRKSNPNATEQEVIDYAVRKFERDTKRTQQSSDLQDRDMYQNSKSAFLKGALAFQTTPRQYQRKVNVASRELGKKILAWDKKAGKGTVGQNIRQILMYHAFMPAFFQWTASGFPIIGFDWDEEDTANMKRAVILGNINSYIVLGQLSLMISDVISNKPWAGDINPSLGIFKYLGRVGKLFARYMNTQDPVKKEEAFNKLIVEVLSIGSPSIQTARFYENYNLIQNTNLTLKQKILLFLQYSKYQVIGKPKKRELSIAERNAKYRRRKK